MHLIKVTSRHLLYTLSAARLVIVSCLELCYVKFMLYSCITRTQRHTCMTLFQHDDAMKETSLHACIACLKNNFNCKTKKRNSHYFLKLVCSYNASARCAKFSKRVKFIGQISCCPINQSSPFLSVVNSFFPAHFITNNITIPCVCLC